MNSSAAPTRRHGRRIAVVGMAAAALFVGGALGVGLIGDSADSGPDRAASAAPGRSALAVQSVVAGAGLGAEIARLQARLADEPADAAGWATLGGAYVQQARITVDPAYYPKAEGALKRSLELNARDNLAAFLGMGALANARHDFAGAVVWAKRAQAVSSYNPDAYAVLADAYTQLGKPAQATAAVQRMLDLSPALPALTRGSYDLEQRGDLAGARALLNSALKNSYVAADIGFCRYYLGELALNSGDLAEAARQYERGLDADPQSATLRHGTAKVAALRGDTATAIGTYADLVGRVPNPQYLVEYGELLTKLGRTAEAAEQFALIETVHMLFTANGGQDELSLAEYEADHGSATLAVRYAKAEWSRRESPVVADALAWALHRAGKDAEALRYADAALAHGWRNALFFHHRAEIHRALGDAASAKADAARVREYNPRFDAELPSFGRAT
ncbi:tetratricopeptide repeat protein [Sporichthya sp.]|uniref:tetratricopeptide repeat protein n=1 Tax=Sporichthya sp. TaxID=65475 RepID=UPI0017991D85|nr:tetratricopeptide repeat protein [Sporichthya sp.]MBA3742274.1 tetratricopeptide repeat protein [Sporichthya sp.]